MKKIVLVNIIASLFLLAGCGDSEKREEKEGEVISTSDTTEANRDSLLDAINKSLLDTTEKK